MRCKKERKKKKFKLFIVGYISVIAFLLLSCTSKPPKILNLNWNLYLYNDLTSNERYEALSIFVNVDDPDGIDDIEKIYIINDNKELFWKLDDTNWVEKKNGASTWLGSNRLVTTTKRNLPRGNYRVMMYDFGGNSVEREIDIDSSLVKLEQIKFPTSNIEKTTIFGLNIPTSMLKNAEIWIYQDGKFITSYQFTHNTIDIKQILKTKRTLTRGFEFEIYYYNTKYKVHLLTGPFYFEPTDLSLQEKDSQKPTKNKSKTNTEVMKK